MEAQVSNIFLKYAKPTIKDPLGGGPPRIPEQFGLHLPYPLIVTPLRIVLQCNCAIRFIAFMQRLSDNGNGLMIANVNHPDCLDRDDADNSTFS